MSRLHAYDGPQIRVTYDVARCIHAAECVRGLPAVFDPRRRPWVSPGAAPADDVADVILRCPTGALGWERLDGRYAEEPESANTLTVSENGPIYARGRIELRDAGGGHLADETRVALCRCGASRNKPYCDGAHEEVEFRAPSELGPGSPKPVVEREGPLVVRLIADGPLRLDGPFVLRPAGSGATAEGGSCSLCRCGGSRRKPYCDGTHREIGFRADDPGP